MEDTHRSSDHDHKSSRGINIIPIIIIIGVVYLFFNYDIETLTKNKQLNKNIIYIKDSIVNFIENYTGDIKNKFFKTDNVLNGNLNTKNIFDLNNFLPQIPNGVDSSNNFDLSIPNNSLNKNLEQIKLEDLDQRPYLR